jgi:hypothetical protein
MENTVMSYDNYKYSTDEGRKTQYVLKNVNTILTKVKKGKHSTDEEKHSSTDESNHSID